MMNLYTHKEKGGIYTLITENAMLKDLARPDDRDFALEWRKGLVLYRAEYDNKDSRYFLRMKFDWDQNFVPIGIRHRPSGEEVLDLIYRPEFNDYRLSFEFREDDFYSENKFNELFEIYEKEF